MNPWRNKNQNKIKAQKHTEDMEIKYSDIIRECVEDSIIYPPTKDIPKFELLEEYDTRIDVVDKDSVTSVFDYAMDSVVAVLNFASYKNPGGRFFDGSIAQEEALCHESILYNVLSDEKFKDEFYKPNLKRLNKALYNNNLIYSPEILFVRDNLKAYADVITCAAPNTGFAMDTCNVSRDKVNSCMKSRIQHLLYSALEQGAEILILGAFGCGVFKNDPYDVAKIFKEELDTTFKGAFEKVVFAIPNNKSENYKAFESVFKEA